MIDILELPYDLIDIYVIKYLNYNAILKLNSTCTYYNKKNLFEKYCKDKFHIMNENHHYISILIRKSQFTTCLFYKYLDNIDLDNYPLEKINNLKIINNDSECTFLLFQYLFNYINFKQKQQFRNFLTCRLIKFFKKLYIKKNNNSKPHENALYIFFNFIKHKDIFKIEDFAIDLYILYNNINSILLKKYNNIRRLVYLSNNKHKLKSTIYMLNSLIKNIKDDMINEYISWEINMIKYKNDKTFIYV